MKYKFTNEVDEKLLFEFLSENIVGLRTNVIKRQAKLGEIKVNGVKTKENVRLISGDRVDIFLPQNSLTIPCVEVVYRDDNIVVVYKPAGMDTENNLVSALKADMGGDVFPVHRLDRNTEGLVILAMDGESKNILMQAIKDRKIGKFYRALLYGTFESKEFTAVAFLVKDEKNSVVKVYRDSVREGKRIETRYKVLEEHGDYSDVEIELVTGRTHQIRAHSAFLGHPVLGDGKYASREVLNKFDFKCQQLRAVRLEFDGLNGKLAYLNGKVIRV